ncbi:MAG: hypothetical protein AB7V39_14785 [Nitrospiraceae bacterium]
MPDYVITGPDGAQYRVTAPDGATEQDVMARVQAQIAQPNAEDPIKATVRKEFEQAKSQGLTSPTTRAFMQGMTFSFGDELMAGALTPFEMIKRKTLSPVEGYKYAKAREDMEVEDARKTGGVPATLAEIGGGVFSGAGIGQIVGRGMGAGAGLLARSGAAAADAGIMGAAAGAGEGSSVYDRLMNAVAGGLLGGIVGGVTPAAIAGASRVLSPITSNIRAIRDPQGFGNSQIARGIVESGQTPDDLALSLTQAANDGQGMFTLADAMGNSGQRMLATTARSPGIARTEVLNALDNRQAGQGRRIAGALAEGFGAPQTAAQTRAAMTAARDRAAAAEYGAVRQDAGPFDPSRVIAHIDEVAPPNPFGGDQPLDPNSIEAVLRGYRGRLTDGRSNLTDFRSAMNTRRDIADARDAAHRAGQGNRSNALGDVVREMDSALESASMGFQRANRNFAQASRDIEAIDAGRTAALRGRSEDTVPAFQGLTQQGRQAFRTGYADPLIENAQGAAFGANKARPLTNDAFRDEAAVMAPGNPLLQRRISREDTMFQTRNAASGNSKTAENLNDDAAMGADPTAIAQFGAQILGGNVGGALRTALGALSNGWNGNTAAVREHVARVLMQNAQTADPRMIQAMLDQMTRQIEQVSRTARALGRGAAGGLAVAPNATGGRR